MKSSASTLRFLRMLLSVALLWAAGAHAGGVFKCTGPNGQIAFTNTVGAFKHCEQVSSYADETPVAAASVPKNPQAHTEYRAAAGDAAIGSVSAPDSGNKPDATSPLNEVRRGAVYKVAKSNGITEYTNVRPDRGAYQVLFTYMGTCFACNVNSKG